MNLIQGLDVALSLEHATQQAARLVVESGKQYSAHLRRQVANRFNNSRGHTMLDQGNVLMLRIVQHVSYKYFGP